MSGAWPLPDIWLLFALSAFAMAGSITLAGAVRVWARARGRWLHIATALFGAVALAMPIAPAFGLEPTGGMIAGGLAALGWLIGAAMAGARPFWVDLLVILATLAFFASYAQMADHDGDVPPIFSGIGLPGSEAEAP